MFLLKAREKVKIVIAIIHDKSWFVAINEVLKMNMVQIEGLKTSVKTG